MVTSNTALNRRKIRVLLAQPRGFCAGVERAIEIVNHALEKYGPPVYVRHEIVHNQHVVDALREKGARFVSELDEVPEGAVTVFSAHGVSRKITDEAKRRHLPVLDATCPLVSRVHKEGQRYAEKGYQLILIGHEGHPEVEGTRGQIPGGVLLISNPGDADSLVVKDPSKLAYITQTTLSVDDTRDVIEALKKRFPEIQGPDVKDICYATQNRQESVRHLAKKVDLLLVVGAPNSSNSNRLCEIGLEMGLPSYLIEDSQGLDPEWLQGVATIGITAGASAPEELVQEVIRRLGDFGELEIQTLDGIEEHVQFKLPPELLSDPQTARA
ncbi:MAG: 4-hydroxy-3-methylbut-2-enyl diphosphate reductase [Rhodospirillaceae bacterium]|nr:MAG: 4-hydroxy-3-methylbut-2-enyl diphosphate reductase [Rhodospirillaceae bacterium]